MADRGDAVTLLVPNHAWARCEVRHTGEGWPKARVAYLEARRRGGGRRTGIGTHFVWVIAQGLSAGAKVDRALANGRFLSVPAALGWMRQQKWARDIEELREWQDIYDA